MPNPDLYRHVELLMLGLDRGHPNPYTPHECTEELRATLRCIDRTLARWHEDRRASLLKMELARLVAVAKRIVRDLELPEDPKTPQN